MPRTKQQRPRHILGSLLDTDADCYKEMATASPLEKYFSSSPSERSDTSHDEESIDTTFLPPPPPLRRDESDETTRMKVLAEMVSPNTANSRSFIETSSAITEDVSTDQGISENSEFFCQSSKMDKGSINNSSIHPQEDNDMLTNDCYKEKKLFAPFSTLHAFVNDQQRSLDSVTDASPHIEDDKEFSSENLLKFQPPNDNKLGNNEQRSKYYSYLKGIISDNIRNQAEKRGKHNTRNTASECGEHDTENMDDQAKFNEHLKKLSSDPQLRTVWQSFVLNPIFQQLMAKFLSQHPKEINPDHQEEVERTGKIEKEKTTDIQTPAKPIARDEPSPMTEDFKQRYKSPPEYSQTHPAKTNSNPAARLPGSSEGTMRYSLPVSEYEQRMNRFDEDCYRSSVIPSNFQMKDWRSRNFGCSYPTLPALPWQNVIPAYGPLNLSKEITGNGDRPSAKNMVNRSIPKDSFRSKRTNYTNNEAKSPMTGEMNPFLDSRPLLPIPHQSYLSPNYQRYLFDPPLSPNNRHGPKRSSEVSPITYGAHSPFNIPFKDMSSLPTQTYFNPWSAIYPPLPGFLNMAPNHLSTNDRMNPVTIPKCSSGSSVSSSSPSRPSSSHSAPNRSNINGKHSNSRSKSQSNSSMDSIHAAIVRRAKEMNKGMDPENMYIECPICHKRIKRLYHFQRHMRIHSGEKSHECPYCPYKSVRKDNLKSHMKTHEKNKYDTNKRSAVSRTNTERTTEYQARPNYRQRPFDSMQDQSLHRPPIISPTNSLSPISSGITSQLFPFGPSRISRSLTPEIPYSKGLPADLRHPRFGIPPIYSEIPYFSKLGEEGLKNSGLLYGRYSTTPSYLMPPLGIDNGQRSKDHRRSPGSITEITSEYVTNSTSEEYMKSKSNNFASRGSGSTGDNDISTITSRNLKEKNNMEDIKFNTQSPLITASSSPRENAEAKSPTKLRRPSDEIVDPVIPKRQKLDPAVSAEENKKIANDEGCMQEINNSNNSNNQHESPPRNSLREQAHTQLIFPRFSSAAPFPFFKKIAAENYYDNYSCEQQSRPEKKDRESRNMSDPPMPGAGKDFQEGEKSDVEYRNQFLYARLNKNELVRGSEGEEKMKTDFASPIEFQPLDDDRENASDLETEESSSEDTVFSNQPYQKDLLSNDVICDSSPVNKAKASGLAIPRKRYFLQERVTKNQRIRSAPDLNDEMNRSEEPASTYDRSSADELKSHNERSSPTSPWRTKSNLFRGNADVEPYTNSDHSVNPFGTSNIPSMSPYYGESGEEKHDYVGASSSKLIYTGVGDSQHHLMSSSMSREFKCRLCEYVGISTSTLQAHMTLHKEDGLYKCQQCDYHGKNLSKLIEHIRIHTGERPFQCDQCSYAAKRKDNLAQHKSVRHDKGKFKGPVKILKLSPSEFLEGPNEPKQVRGHKEDDEQLASTFRYNKEYDAGFQPLTNNHTMMTMSGSTNLKSNDRWKLNYDRSTIPAFSPVSNGLHSTNRLEKMTRLGDGKDKQSMLHMSNMFAPLNGVPHYPFNHFLTYDNLSTKFMAGHPLMTQSIISTLPNLDLHTNNLSEADVKYASSLTDTPPNISSSQKHHGRPPNRSPFSKALQQCAR